MLLHTYSLCNYILFSWWRFYEAQCIIILKQHFTKNSKNSNSIYSKDNAANADVDLYSLFKLFEYVKVWSGRKFLLFVQWSQSVICPPLDAFNFIIRICSCLCHYYLILKTIVTLQGMSRHPELVASDLI